MKKIFHTALASTAVIVGMMTYYLLSNSFTYPDSAQARPLVAPTEPHVLYLTKGEQIGLPALQALNSEGIRTVESWAAIKSLGEQKPVDALLIDRSFAEGISPDEKNLLQAQFKDGVVIVGIGTEDDVLAKALGLKTLTLSTETTRQVDAADYLLVYALALAQASDLKLLEEANWVDKSIQGENTNVPGIQGKTLTSFGKARGRLVSAQDLSLFVKRLRISIQGMYETRAEYQQLVSTEK